MDRIEFLQEGLDESLHDVIELATCNPLLPGIRITVSVPDTTYKIGLTSVVVRLS